MSTPTHILAVTGMVTNPNGKVLMIRSPRRGWEFPGGQVEQGEDLPAALQREIHEESGITARVGRLVGIYSKTQSPYLMILCFECIWVSGEPETSEESVEVEWVLREDVLARITHPAIRDRVKDMLDGDGQVIYRVYTTDPYVIHSQRYL